MSVITAVVTHWARNRGAGAAPLPPNILQPFLDGDYNGGAVKLYSTANGFPHIGLDTLLATYTFATPAVGSVVSPTELALDLVSDDAVIANRSGSSLAKYVVLVNAADTAEVILSVGPSSNDFDARVVVSSMDMFAGDTLSISSLHVSASDTLTHYSVTRTPSSGIISDAEYIATPQALDGSNAVVHIIGRSVVGTYVAVSGAGADGSVDSTPVVSNRYGVCEPINCVAGQYPKVEKTTVIDEDLFVGSSSNLTVGDVVDSYVITLPTDTPGPDTTKTATAQAMVNGDPALVAGRVVTWTKTGLTGTTFGSSTSTTNSSGIATNDVTFGAVGSSGTITGTDVQGQTGTSDSVTVTTAPATYHHLTKDFSSGTITTASITVPANAFIIVQAITLVDPTKTFTCAGSALSFSTPSGGSITVAPGYNGNDQIGKVFVAQAGGGGFTGSLTLDSNGADHLLLCMYEVGYVTATEASGTIHAVSDSFAADNSQKSLSYATTPAVTSLLLSAWSMYVTGTTPGAFTPKSGWASESETSFFSSGVGGRFSVDSFAGSSDPAQATPTGGTYGVQIGVALEVVHA